MFWTVFFKTTDRVSFSISARIIGSGKVNINEYTLNNKVFLISMGNWGEDIKYLKCLRPTHLLPVIPREGTKSLKAI